MSLFEKVRSTYNQIVDVPSTDVDDARRRKLLNIILLGMFVVACILMVGVGSSLFLSILTPNEAAPPIIALLATIIGVFIFYFINRWWSGIIAGYSFLFFLIFVITLSDSPAELANGRSVFLFAIPIVVASVLIGSTSTFLFYFLTSVEIILLVLSVGKPIATGIFPVSSFFFLAIISWLSARSLEQALKDLRAINLNLDRLVEQKTQELATTLSRELVLAGRNQAILDSIADGVIVFDANHTAILANPALSQITGISLKNMTGIHLSDFVKTDALSPASQGMIMGLIEHPEKTEAGARVEWGKKTLSLSVARVQDASTRHAGIGAVAVFRDVTKEAELEKMKQTFVAVVSHELRTPLNAIMGYAEMLKEAIYGPINEEQSSAIERVIINTGRMLSMVGDLLDEAQLKAGKLSIRNQPFKTDMLLKTMHTTMDKITSDKGIYLTDEVDPNMPETISGDAQRLHQILINLVNNSAKFTDTGGIHVRIARSDPAQWMIEVKDTGLGIPEKDIPYIFDTFRQVEEATTRRHGGFGLGLAIVKQLVDLMKGKISVQSEIDKGSVFTVILPLQ